MSLKLSDTLLISSLSFSALLDRKDDSDARRCDQRLNVSLDLHLRSSRKTSMPIGLLQVGMIGIVWLTHDAGRRKLWVLDPQDHR